MASFSRLVRFENDDGRVFYGEVPGNYVVTRETLMGSTVAIYTDHTPFEEAFTLTDKKEVIAKVLAPLPAVPIFECIGVNYLKHLQETGNKQPQYPVVFKKPADALAGPFEDIPIHPECLQMDYEAELCAVISRDCKNATLENAMSYVLGYTVGNDVSSRYWQWEERSGRQHGSAKGFDKFAPLGPVIVSPAAIGDPHALSIKTIVNGDDVRQSAGTDELIFKIPNLIQHLSRATTLRKGTVIMTGTPSGVAAFMKPQMFLKDGDIVEVEIEKSVVCGTKCVLRGDSEDEFITEDVGVWKLIDIQAKSKLERISLHVLSALVK